jgi:LysR family transcriptional regulator (chromosome initiation inhibitor)
MYLPLKNLLNSSPWGLPMACCRISKVRHLIGTGQIFDLSPDCHVPVKLYWHCWNLKSDLLKKLTQQLISQAKTLLEE